MRGNSNDVKGTLVNNSARGGLLKADSKRSNVIHYANSLPFPDLSSDFDVNELDGPLDGMNFKDDLPRFHRNDSPAQRSKQ